MPCRTEKPKAKPKAIEDKPLGRLLNKTQKKQAGRLRELIATSMAGLEESVQDAASGKYDEELPPSLLPKCRLQIVSMKEMSANLDILLSEGWRGDANQSLQEVQTKMKLCKDLQTRLETIIEECKDKEE